MAQLNDMMRMLDLMVQPGFCVQDRVIVKVNPAAESCHITPGTQISKLLETGKKEYAALSGGRLYLTLDLYGQTRGASVTRMDDFDVFLLDQDGDRAELQAMALAARELREPLTGVMASADSLFPMEVLREDPAAREQMVRLNRGLYQLLRIISNMSDADRYASGTAARMETIDITARIGEIFSKAAALTAHAGVTLEFTNLKKSVFSLADGDMLERAILNLLSNALKFTPRGGSITASVAKRGNLLSLTIQDSGDGVPDNILGSFYSRYLRQPSVEDSRQSIGLGMVLVRSTAAQHGGTVLLDQPAGAGARITMTIQIRQNPDPAVRSPRLRVDYAGERDRCLLELSESLPAELYDIP